MRSGVRVFRIEVAHLSGIVGEFRIGGGKVDEGYYDTGGEKRQRSDWPPR